MEHIEALDDGPNWEGAGGLSEHRTVGAHRARCFGCSEWCYPESLCLCCDQVALPERWRGLNVGDVLAELRAEVEALRTNLYPNHGALQRVLNLLDGKQR